MRAKSLAAACVLLSAPALAESVHDGRWQVEIETTVGACPRSSQAVVTIKDERLVAIDAEGVEPWGYIDGTNTFVGRFTRGDKIARANGDVRGQTASGPWSSNTDYCGGRWTARKID